MAHFAGWNRMVNRFINGKIVLVASQISFTASVFCPLAKPADLIFFLSLFFMLINRFRHPYSDHININHLKYCTLIHPLNENAQIFLIVVFKPNNWLHACSNQ